MFIPRDHCAHVPLNCNFQHVVIWRILRDDCDGSPGQDNPRGSVQPFEDVWQIRVSGDHPKPLIGQNPGQLFEKLWAGQEKESPDSAGAEDAGRWPFPSYGGDQRVGVENNLQERRTLRVASLTTSGLTPALATDE